MEKNEELTFDFERWVFGHDYAPGCELRCTAAAAKRLGARAPPENRTDHRRGFAD
jgi:hypothetical protein